MWILIGFILGSTVTSSHETREACEGRAVMLREKGVMTCQCVEQRSTLTSSNSIQFYVPGSTTINPAR